MFSGGEEADSDVSREQTKSSRGTLWRLKDKASKLTKSNKPSRSQTIEQEVSDFLRPGSSSTSASASASAKPPRLDTSSPLTHAGTPDDRLSPPAYVAPAVKKRRKPPGLHVDFVKEQPEIIGEGGDEAETPAENVIEAWRASGKTYEFFHSSENNEPRSVGRKNSLPAPDSLMPGYDPRAPRASIQRAPTRHIAVDGWSDKRRSMSMEEGLVQASKSYSAESGSNSQQNAPADIEPLAPTNIEPIGQTRSLPGHDTQPQPISQNAEPQAAAHIPQFMDKPYVQAQRQLTRKPIAENEQSTSEFVPFNPSRQPTIPVIEPPSNEPRPPLNTQELSFRTAQSQNDSDVVQSPDSISRSIHSDHSQQDLRALRSTSNTTTERRPSPHGPVSPDYRKSFAGSTTDEGVLSAAEAAGDDFYSRLEHLRGMFRLASDKVNDLTEKTLSFWLRASSWWFLRGRTMLESEVRSTVRAGVERPSSRGENGHLPQNKQCYVDLAKAWWIIEEVLPELLQVESGAPTKHPDRIDGLTHEQLFETYHESRKEMTLFALSLQKRDLFPPPALMIQGADPLIWIPYPGLSPGIYAVTAGLDPRSLSKHLPPGQLGIFPMPVSDTTLHFCYGRVFGEAEIMGDSGSNEDDDMHFPCMISIVRDRNFSHVEFMISSQDGQINVHVQVDRRFGPTWEDVDWKVTKGEIKTHSLRIRLSRDVGVVIRLWEADFKTLWGIYDYNRRVETHRQPMPNEEILFKDHVAAFHYVPPQGAQATFPTNPIKHCQVRLFQMNDIIHDGASKRSVFSGYRLVAVTPSHVKTVKSISRMLGDGLPILVNKLTGEGGAPALGLAVYDSGKRENIYLTFDSSQARSVLQNILSGADPSVDECFSAEIPIESFSVAQAANAPADAGQIGLPSSLSCQNLRIINQGKSLDSAAVMFSNRLRVCIFSNHGTILDRINLGTGEVRMGLDCANQGLIKLHRPAHRNLTMMFSEHELKKEPTGLKTVQQTVMATASSPTQRVYLFKSLPSLHQFQTLVTGFSVIYDGKASSFSISRRRAVVPIHKRLEASAARLQILKDENIVQLVAFLQDFAHGKCMNFALRGTDQYESFSRSGTHYLRFVDAKFAMPKPKDDESWDVVCLDQVEYASEHEDIMVGFATEDERELLIRALPASVSKVSKMAAAFIM